MESYHYQQLPLLSSPQLSSSWPQTNHIVNTSSTLTTTTTPNPNPKERRNGKRGPGIKLSTDPQSVAARHRRHRISDRFRILKSLVPGGSKMDTVSMLEEAITYVKFLKTQICWLHQAAMIVPPAAAAAAAAEETTAALTLPSNYNYNDAAQASIYSSYDCSDNLIPTHHHQEMLSYSFPPSPPPLPSFPNSSYQGGEDMHPNVSFIYYDEHYLD